MESITSNGVEGDKDGCELGEGAVSGRGVCVVSQLRML